MEKRYQVFISSTYEDLQDERKEVMQALLELDCIPAGMELFPASNEDQWSLIKRVIDDCDYYLLVMGGRYGSCNDNGISFTEQEFRYALDKDKPIISFLHRSPENISSKNTEQDSEKKQRLNSFRELAQKKVVRYWTSPADLGSVVSRSMIKLIKQFPAIGWVKADNVDDVNSAKEILRLRDRIDQLQRTIDEQSTRPPTGSEKLAQGEEITNMSLIFYGDNRSHYKVACKLNFVLSWNDIFAAFSPYLVNEGTEDEIEKSIVEMIKTKFLEEILNFKKEEKMSQLYAFRLDSQEFQTIKVQFKALGLIQQSLRSRSVKNTKSYWTLTSFGDHLMTQLIALPTNVVNDEKFPG